MKVLQINAVYGIGSTGHIVEDIHTCALKNGIESYVAYSTSPLKKEQVKNGYVIGNKFGKKIHALLSRITGKQAYYSRHSTKKLIKFIDKISPQIVHLHNLHSNYIHFPKLLDYLAKHGVPTVLTLHDCWFYTGGCFHYASVSCDEWKKDCKKCIKHKIASPRKVYHADKTLCDRKKYLLAINNLTVVGVSNWISNEAENTFLKDKNIVTIHNGIDFEFFKGTKSNLKKVYGIENKFVILGPANKWLAEINRDTLKIICKNLDEDSVLVIFGCDLEDISTLPDNVVTIGYTKDKDELRKIYSMADVFVNCTREESLSLVNVEAQACGTPVITYEDTGVKETVDGKCGFTVKTGDSKALLEKILHVKKQGKDFYKEQCREFVKNKFDKEKNYAKYISLYKQINS